MSKEQVESNKVSEESSDQLVMPSQDTEFVEVSVSEIFIREPITIDDDGLNTNNKNGSVSNVMFNKEQEEISSGSSKKLMVPSNYNIVGSPPPVPRHIESENETNIKLNDAASEDCDYKQDGINIDDETELQRVPTRPASAKEIINDQNKVTSIEQDGEDETLNTFQSPITLNEKTISPSLKSSSPDIIEKLSTPPPGSPEHTINDYNTVTTMVSPSSSPPLASATPEVTSNETEQQVKIVNEELDDQTDKTSNHQIGEKNNNNNSKTELNDNIETLHDDSMQVYLHENDDKSSNDDNLDAEKRFQINDENEVKENEDNIEDDKNSQEITDIIQPIIKVS